MSKSAVVQFSTSNVLLEDSQVQLSFPAATDKNGDTVSYYAKIYWQPIYCSVSGENYISIETTDVVHANTEIPLTVTGSTTLQSTITLNFDNKLSTDVRIYIEVIARDGINDHPHDPPVLTSDYYYVIRHQIPTLALSSAEWVPGAIREVQLNGSIVDYGFTTPGNLVDLLATDLIWQAWRTGLETALGSINLTFNFKIAYSSDNINFSTPATYDITVIKELINATPGNAAYTNDLSFSFSFNKDATIPIPIESITQENSYFFKAYISSSNFTLSLDSNSTSILLTSNTPLFVMRNGIIQINLPKTTTAKTGAIMAARGPQQDVINGQSLALYDLHTESGQSEVANSPSIGFFDNLHNLMAKVGINYNISTDTGDIEITNFLTNGNIILTPSGTGVVKTGNLTAPHLILNAVGTPSGTAETAKGVWFRTDGKNRRSAISNSTDESGDNAGSNFAISRYDDDGNLIDTPFSISRATGKGFFSQTPRVDSNDIWHEGNMHVERGSWSPTMYGTNGGTLTTDRQAGAYERVNNEVTLWWRLRGTNSDMSGNIRIGGIPFLTAAHEGVDSVPGWAMVRGFNADGLVGVFPVIPGAAGGDYIGLWKHTVTSQYSRTMLTSADIVAGSLIEVHGVIKYRVS